MSELKNKLDQLGLSQYFDNLVAEGFDSWATVLDITESDLSSLNVKLGHRRKLQRAIADSRGAHEPALTSLHGSQPKRKYRRHPKADENAPERPSSAYVIFSNHMREELKHQELSFTEIAKIVGERWQVLSAETRDIYERQAAASKERYYAELAGYKKTAEFAQYQEYLADFKLKHAPPTTEGKRSRLEPETSTSTPSSADAERGTRKASSGRIDGVSVSQGRSPSSPSAPSVLSLGQSQMPKPISPAMSSFSSPRPPEQYYSPMSASPVSAASNREAAVAPDLHGHGTLPSNDFQEAYPDYFPAGSSATLAAARPPTLESTQFSVAHRQSDTRDNPRRISRASPALPALMRDDTTISSEGTLSSSFYGQPYSSMVLPPLEAPKQHSHRILPQPIPSAHAAPSPLDQGAQASPGQQPSLENPRYGTPLAALIRAGELARDADSASPDGGTGA